MKTTESRAFAARLTTLLRNERPRPAPLPRPDSDHIPAAVRREVWKRDKGCCQWPLEGGGICGSKLRVEDHVNPRCLGGKPTAKDLRLACDVHNQLAARLKLGDALMDRYTRDPRRTGPPGTPTDRAATPQGLLAISAGAGS